MPFALRSFFVTSGAAPSGVRRVGALVRPTTKTGLSSWLTTVDHKRMG